MNLDKLPKQPNILARLDHNDDGIIRNHIGNVMIMLRHHNALRGILAYNEFRHDVILMRPVPRHDEQPTGNFDPRPIEDTDITAIHIWLSLDNFPSVPRANIANAVPAAALENTFHPVREYLNLITWDGKERLRGWLSAYLGAVHRNADELDYLENIAANALIAAVARIMSPGCKADHVLIIEGRQGIGKSTALKILAGEAWFSDNLPHDLTSKDAKDHLRGVWIVELPELGQLQKHEVEIIKAFITRQEEKYRPAYGRFEIVYPRQCVFFGTTNSATYLRDDSGNRRFWPVRCDPAGGVIDLEGLARDRDQLWAEAVTWFRAGENWHFTDATVIEEATRQQTERFADDVWESKVLTYANANEKFTIGDVLQNALEVVTPRQDRAGQNRVASILRSNGFEAGKRSKRGRTWVRV
jgi:predicted P-loop ATPase